MLPMNSQAGSAIRAFALAATAACALCGCRERNGHAALADAEECSVRVIVGFATAVDDALLADLERTNAFDLEPLEPISNDLRAYTLRAAAANDGCAAAIDRLRGDERVRSVDLDSRREIHEQQRNAQG